MYALMNDYQNNAVYNTAVYCRLSREDEDTNGLSESITNQKEFLTQYVLNNGWNLVDYYVDDGYSGTTFDRVR